MANLTRETEDALLNQYMAFFCLFLQPYARVFFFTFLFNL